MPVLRYCVTCSRPFAGTGLRCAEHTRPAPVKKRRAGYTSSERSRRAAAVDAWRRAVGDWCPGYQRAGHPATDLTADHIHAVAAGGEESGALTVLCRSCNSRKGAR